MVAVALTATLTASDPLSDQSSRSNGPAVSTSRLSTTRSTVPDDGAVNCCCDVVSKELGTVVWLSTALVGLRTITCERAWSAIDTHGLAPAGTDWAAADTAPGIVTAWTSDPFVSVTCPLRQSVLSIVAVKLIASGELSNARKLTRCVAFGPVAVY